MADEAAAAPRLTARRRVLSLTCRGVRRVLCEPVRLRTADPAAQRAVVRETPAASCCRSPG